MVLLILSGCPFYQELLSSCESAQQMYWLQNILLEKNTHIYIYHRTQFALPAI